MLEINKIYCSDCIELMKQIDDNSIGCVITSPPYNVGIDYGDYKDSLEFENYILWLVKTFELCIEKLQEGGHLIIQVANTGRQPYRPISHSLGYHLSKNNKVEFRGEIIWNKNNETAKTAWGSWLSANKPSIRDRHEYLLVFRKLGDRKGISDISKEQFMKYTESIWSVQPDTTRLLKHPATFPIKLVDRILRLYSFVDDLVYDPFMGSGTTAVACKNLKRNYIGSEISEKYCEIARQRLRQGILL